MEGFRDIVIDTGSLYTKVGFAGDDGPMSVFRTIVGYPKTLMVGRENLDYYSGKWAEENMGVLKISCPIKGGEITNMDDMGKLYEYSITKELKKNLDEHNVLVTEPPLNSKQNRETMASIMFEKFGVRGFSVAVQGVLSALSAGKLTGLACDMGEEASYFVPVYEGRQLTHAVQKMGLGGRQITEYLMNILKQNNINLKNKEALNKLKEKFCYVAMDYEKELTSVKEEIYTLPDEEMEEDKEFGFKVKTEKIKAPEILFRPKSLGFEHNPIQSYAFNAIKGCDIDIQNDLYENIILAGGTSLFTGLQERLQKEIGKLEPRKTSVNVIANPERKYASWIGGSILASSDSFKTSWITKEEYEEQGEIIVNTKCY